MLEKLFFNEKVALKLEHFIIHEKWEQNKKELCEILEIYPKLMKKILKRLLEYKIVKVTKQIARSKFYKLNSESKLIPYVRGFVQELSIQNSLITAKNKGEIDKSGKKTELNKKDMKI